MTREDAGLSRPAPLDRLTIRALVQAALREDAAQQDLTSNALVPVDQQGRGVVVAKSDGVVCGLQFALETYYAVEPRVRWMPAVSEGLRVAAGATIAHVDGPVHAILRGERVALNYLGRLSGTATQTADCVRAVAGSGARILDTRKTTPGLRVAERYAVRVGGGGNHRNDLRSAMLVKDNHIAAVRARGGSLADAVRLALAAAGPATAVEVEVTSLDELREAIDAGARAVLLDNFTPPALAEAVRLARPAGVTTEASGGVTLATLPDYAASGVDFISLGALTHSVRPMDVSLQVVPEALSGG
jgi:nicotinate-nucleotide pyrophosphorylase (carboxylating)